MNRNKTGQGARIRSFLGWLGVALTVIFTNVWTYWGIVENFHEGWYSKSLIENLLMLLVQYLLLGIVFIVLAVFSIAKPRIGLSLHFGLALWSAWFFRSAHFSVVGLMIVIPLLGLGFLYFYGRPEPRRWAYRLIIVLPLLIILSVAPVKIVHWAQRVNDGGFGIRWVEGNGVRLAWAPRGPGWPDGGVSYHEAVKRCKYLSEDGMILMPEEQNIWRLPTVDEAVRSMTLHNENAGGRWDPKAGKALYEKTPDKETPLWDSHSKVIYYWVQNESAPDQAYIVVYDGGVFQRDKERKYGHLSFRAVKSMR
jgi:hypothetical protein